ncbi:hypothetical protein [Idiomarina xiamenensis]|uniref:Uncharacterized protein n=1 Tax=Idiomarina xiamenensis 10-D-4 TaxID=740709 RepID=K2KAF8_9GAMM|nr:hypothetical protein [Idiomarina xiamenensis]EKE79914.1 hypothetical protein A10D4_12443 [Idiomarina xiamenensis 10-D-4]
MKKISAILLAFIGFANADSNSYETVYVDLDMYIGWDGLAKHMPDIAMAEWYIQIENSSAPENYNRSSFLFRSSSQISSRSAHILVEDYPVWGAYKISGDYSPR